MSFGAVDTSERSGNGRGFTGPRLPTTKMNAWREVGSQGLARTCQPPQRPQDYPYPTDIDRHTVAVLRIIKSGNSTGIPPRAEDSQTVQIMFRSEHWDDRGSILRLTLLRNPFEQSPEAAPAARHHETRATRATPVCSRCRSDDITCSATVQWSNEFAGMAARQHVRPARSLQQLRLLRRTELAAPELERVLIGVRLIINTLARRLRTVGAEPG